MSKTYRKYVKCGFCTGSNTEYYRNMNRKCRHKNNHSLRNLLANYDIDEVNDKIMTEEPIHNSWDEPTDGTFLVSKEDKSLYTQKETYYNNKHYGNALNYWNHKFGKYFKNKHFKH